MDDDDFYLQQVEKLASTSRRAREEAEMFAAQIEDPEKKKQAESILELN